MREWMPHGTRVCDYRAYNGILSDELFKEAVQTFGQQINYFGVGYDHQNEFVEIRIKELTLDRHNPLMHFTGLWP